MKLNERGPRPPAHPRLYGIKLNKFREDAIIGFKLIGLVVVSIWENLKRNTDELVSSLVASFSAGFLAIKIVVKEFYATLIQQQLMVKEVVNPLADLSKEKEELATLWDEVDELNTKLTELKTQAKIEFEFSVTEENKDKLKNLVDEAESLRSTSAENIIEIYIKYNIRPDDVYQNALDQLKESLSPSEYIDFVSRPSEQRNEVLGDYTGVINGVGAPRRDVAAQLSVAGS